jgi:predicted RNase H-like nuclease (RuvC/YqgF family)
MGIFGKSKHGGDTNDKPSSPGARAAYSIDEAIALMRSLPSESPELVVKVVKGTLESLKIQLADIIDDASRKEAMIEQRIGGLKGEIGELEDQIATRRREIAALEADLAETRSVRQKLELAEGKKRLPARHDDPLITSELAVNEIEVMMDETARPPR